MQGAKKSISPDSNWSDSLSVRVAAGVAGGIAICVAIFVLPILKKKVDRAFTPCALLPCPRLTPFLPASVPVRALALAMLRAGRALGSAICCMHCGGSLLVIKALLCRMHPQRYCACAVRAAPLRKRQDMRATVAVPRHVWWKTSPLTGSLQKHAAKLTSHFCYSDGQQKEALPKEHQGADDLPTKDIEAAPAAGDNGPLPALPESGAKDAPVSSPALTS